MNCDSFSPLVQNGLTKLCKFIESRALSVAVYSLLVWQTPDSSLWGFSLLKEFDEEKLLVFAYFCRASNGKFSDEFGDLIGNFAY